MRIFKNVVRAKFIASALARVVCLAVALSAVPATAATPKGNSGELPTSKQTPAQPLSINNMPRMGLDTGDQMDPAALDNALASGAKVVRLSVYWNMMEPNNTTPVSYTWALWDSIFARIKARGLQPMATILNCPLWACVNAAGPLRPNMNSEAAQFVGALAARYGAPTYDAHYWELWNEPDSAGGADRQQNWGMHPAEYAQMLAAVYPAVKAADPNAVVLIGGLAYDNWFNQGGFFNPDFMPDLLDAGGAQYSDGLGFHYYLENAHGWTSIDVKVNVMRAVMAAHGAPNLPLICTELGKTSSATYGSSEALQARYAVQANVHAAKAGLRTAIWYLNRDFEPREPGWGLFASNGLTRLDNTRKPSFTAMQVFSREVGSNVYLGQLGAADGVVGALEGYRFVAAPVPPQFRQVSVIWNNASTAATLTVPANQAPNLLSAVNINGQTVAIQPGPNGTKLVSVGADPVYLRWNAPRFADVAFDAWMYTYVEYLASRGVISGYVDGTFRPGNPSTRGQFAKMAVLGMGWTIDTSGGPHFRDVPTTHTFYTFIETAYNHQVIAGYNCGGSGEPCPGLYFRPGNNITRAQISKMIVLSKGWTVITPSTPTFSDVPTNYAFYGYVETSVSHGVVSGYSDGTFRPGNNATRAQLSKMLALALQQP